MPPKTETLNSSPNFHSLRFAKVFDTGTSYTYLCRVTSDKSSAIQLNLATHGVMDMVVNVSDFTRVDAAAAIVGVIITITVCHAVISLRRRSNANSKSWGKHTVEPAPLIQCIRERQSVFPRSYVNGVVHGETVQRLLEAAMWAPYHGPEPPWRFVILGKRAMVAMQQLTLSFYDKNWRETGWANDQFGTEQEFLEWRHMTESEINGRWGPVSWMIAIIMRRQAGNKRIPEWEEAAATACAVQNMHLQATAHPGLACYWSSWHAAARDSQMMKDFLCMKREDKCLGFFMLASCDPNLRSRRRRRPESHLSTEWRA